MMDNFAYSTRVHGTLCGEFFEMVFLPERTQGAVPAKNAGGATAKQESAEEIRDRSVKRAQKRIRQLVNSNSLYVLHTLTYATKHPEYYNGERPFRIIPVDDQRDRESVIGHWREFRKRMEKYCRKHGCYFRYICVIERHTGKRLTKDKSIKTGTYHIHFVTDRIYGKRLLQAKWKHGFCNYADFRKGCKSQDMQDGYDKPPPDNPGVYVSKYIGKDGHTGEGGKRRYWRSKNLYEPVKVHSSEAFLLRLLPHDVVFRKRQDIQYDGGETYIDYLTIRIKSTPFASLVPDRPSTPAEANSRRRRDKIAAIETYHKYLQSQKEKQYDDTINGELQRGIDSAFTRKHGLVKAADERLA